MKNIYDGVATIDSSGRATVALPLYFEALNSDFRYQLTAIGRPIVVYVSREISSNSFEIAGEKAGDRVSWQVTGIRKDSFANKYRLKPQTPKTGLDQGKYHHPECFGAPATSRIRYQTLPPEVNSSHGMLRPQPR